MRKLKQKLKRAVYNLFRDQILQIVADQPELRVYPSHEIIDWVEIRSILDIERFSEMEYTIAKERAIADLLKTVTPFIIFEENAGPDPDYRNLLKVEMRLFVGKKN